MWHFGAAETCSTETLMQDGEQESIAVVDYEDPSATEAIEVTTQEQVKSSIQKNFERDEPKRCENLMNSTSNWRSMSQKCDRHRARKSGHNGLKHERTQTIQQTMSIVCYGSEHRRSDI